MSFDPVALQFLLIWSVFLAGSGAILFLIGRLKQRNLASRILAWIPIIILMFLAIHFGKWVFFALILAVFAASHWELTRLVEEIGFLRHAIALGLALPWLLLIQFHKMPVWALLSILLFLGPVLYLALFMKHKHPRQIFPFALMLGAGFSLWILLGRAGGFRLVVFVFSVTALNDMTAFFFGTVFGGRKPFPRLSPNKTLAGYAGGILSAVVAAHVFRFAVPELNPVAVTLAGIILAIAGSLGDLLASKIKRIHGVKDFSSMMGKMGGVFDRCDSLLPSAWIASIAFLYFL
ncbi:MAG: phosphatidate cytidylyltransferase [Candidatus Aminicenantes bacterium]|nr:phosphatidate cytidylyltransferase [Candidatus Aminicenantes bacterium]